MPKSRQPEFHKIDAARLIEAAHSCGVKNFKLVVEGRKLSMIVNGDDHAPVKPKSLDGGQGEIVPRL